MLLGHVGVALAAKRAAPKAPLGILLAASEALGGPEVTGHVHN
jgi:hypothetical protein